MILCAQAKTLNPQDWNLDRSNIVIATTNVKHLTHFADARHWRDIS